MESSLIAIIAGLIFLELLSHAVSVVLILPYFERRVPFGVEPAAPDPNAEVVSFPTTNGLTLRGSLYQHEEQPARGLVVFCPETEGNHWSAMSYCEGLWQAGFDVLSFDFRNQGESDRMPGYDAMHWLSDYEVKDVLAAVAYANRRDELKHLPMGLLGISRGGGAALAAAAKCPHIRCVACEGAFSTDSMLKHYSLRWAELVIPLWLMKLIPGWHMSVTFSLLRFIGQIRKGCRYTRLERWLPHLRRKSVWLIADGGDTYVKPEITREICRRIGAGCRDFWVVPDAKHNMARQSDPETYDRKMVDFFAESLLATQIPQEVGEPQP